MRIQAMQYVAAAGRALNEIIIAAVLVVVYVLVLGVARCLQLLEKKSPEDDNSFWDTPDGDTPTSHPLTSAY